MRNRRRSHQANERKACCVVGSGPSSGSRAPCFWCSQAACWLRREAFARIALDGVSNEQAVREMERAGTGKSYTGLYGGVRAFRPPTKAELDELKVGFPEVAPLPTLARSMVGIDQRFDRLTQLQKAG